MHDELAVGNVPETWAEVDIRKPRHPCVVINTPGERLLSRRAHNDESQLLVLIGDGLDISHDALWAVDLHHGGCSADRHAGQS
ncbi:MULTISPECIES: hypothetical protein [Streptomyces]|uniref:hypothetical protein n=1 Tax=Streptomyces TaxID=1883 RepID=UPI00343FE6D4